MNDYKSCINFDDEPIHMKIFLAFHNQIIEHESELQKQAKRSRNKETLVRLFYWFYFIYFILFYFFKDFFFFHMLHPQAEKILEDMIVSNVIKRTINLFKLGNDIYIFIIVIIIRLNQKKYKI